MLETIISKTLEWQCGIQFASLDVGKAFDKIEHGALFPLLIAQSIRDGYFDLLMAMHEDQTGAVPGFFFFPRSFFPRESLTRTVLLVSLQAAGSP